jgi:hypothetical protein
VKSISIPWFIPEFDGPVERERVGDVLASNYLNAGRLRDRRQ